MRASPGQAAGRLVAVLAVRGPRLGALLVRQGLAEVVGGLGVDKMHKLMPEIVSTAERMDIAPHVKDGYIMMFIYMPGVFPEQFRPYIGQVYSASYKYLSA